jgi:hypothetical protein
MMHCWGAACPSELCGATDTSWCLLVSGSQVLGLGFDVAACHLVFLIRLLSWVIRLQRL